MNKKNATSSVVRNNSVNKRNVWNSSEKNIKSKWGLCKSNTSNKSNVSSYASSSKRSQTGYWRTFEDRAVSSEWESFSYPFTGNFWRESHHVIHCKLLFLSNNNSTVWGHVSRSSLVRVEGGSPVRLQQIQLSFSLVFKAISELLADV